MLLRSMPMAAWMLCSKERLQEVQKPHCLDAARSRSRNGPQCFSVVVRWRDSRAAATALTESMPLPRWLADGASTATGPEGPGPNAQAWGFDLPSSQCFRVDFYTRLV